MTEPYTIIAHNHVPVEIGERDGYPYLHLLARGPAELTHDQAEVVIEQLRRRNNTVAAPAADRPDHLSGQLAIEVQR